MPQFLINFFNLIFIQPVTNALVVFYDIFVRMGLPGAFGFAIIAITILVRFLMHPFFKKQITTAKRMKEIKPHLDALQKKHKKDPQKLQKEQMRIYQEAGINPASGCLFAIIQIPLIYGLYHTLQLFLTYDKDGKVVQQINDKLYHPALAISQIDPHFFAYNLALSPAKSGLWYYYLVPVITAILQFFQSKVTMPQMHEESKKEKKKELKKKDEDEKTSTSDDFQKAMGTQMRYIFPIMIGYFSYTLPLGLSVYWNTFSLFTITQHYIDEKRTKSKDIKNK